MIIDYRYKLSTSQGANLQTLTMPFTANRVGVSLLMNSMPVNLVDKAVILEFYADDIIIERFKPESINFDRSLSGSEVDAILEFKPNLIQLKP